jgi:hypothetical protein
MKRYKHDLTPAANTKWEEAEKTREFEEEAMI